jgi:hypothetical protein
MLQNLAAEIINCYEPGWRARRPMSPSTMISKLIFWPPKTGGWRGERDTERLTAATIQALSK